MKKTFCSLMLVFLLFVAVFPLSAGAATSEIIDKAEITAVINTDGTVDVKEIWTVSYVNASDCFYRNIDAYSSDSALTLLQKYDEIKDVSVRIDGKETKESPAGVNTYSFMKSADEKSYEIVINCPSAQITREYEISYTICGAVKKNSRDADFSFMFIGKTFPYTSNNVAVTVNVPEGTDSERIGIAGDAEATVDGTCVKFDAKRVYDTYSVQVFFEDSAFEDGALASYSSIAETMKKFGNSVLEILPYIAAVLFVVAVILFVLVPDRLLRFSAEKRALKRFDQNDNTVTVPEDISPCQAYKMLMPVSRIRPKTSSAKVPVLFAAAILECIEKGYIVAESDNLIVGTPQNESSAYIMSVINFLKTFCEKKDNRYVLDSVFAEKVAAECSSRYDVMVNYLASFYGLIPETNNSFFRKKENIEVYEKLYLLKLKSVKMKNKPTFAECTENVLSGVSTADAEIFSMLFSTAPDKIFAKNGKSVARPLCDALASMYGVYVKSK